MRSILEKRAPSGPNGYWVDRYKSNLEPEGLGLIQCVDCGNYCFTSYADWADWGSDCKCCYGDMTSHVFLQISIDVLFRDIFYSLSFLY
jgi:hypothetical protein